MVNPMWNRGGKQIHLSLKVIATNREARAERVFGEDGGFVAETRNGGIDALSTEVTKPLASPVVQH